MVKRDRPHPLGMNNTVVKGLTEAEKARSKKQWEEKVISMK
jgi:hypothetical protein